MSYGYTDSAAYGREEKELVAKRNKERALAVQVRDCKEIPERLQKALLKYLDFTQTSDFIVHTGSPECECKGESCYYDPR